MPIFYAQYRVEPLPYCDQFETCGGAYVNCWVQAAAEVEALEIVSTTFKELGWRIVLQEEECHQVEEHLYDSDEEGRESFAEAVNNGECYVFHQWPNEPQDDDNIH